MFKNSEIGPVSASKRSSEIRVTREHSAGPLRRFFLGCFHLPLAHSLLSLRVPPALSASPFALGRASYSKRSSLWTTTPALSGLPEATSCTRVFGTCDFSRPRSRRTFQPGPGGAFGIAQDLWLSAALESHQVTLSARRSDPSCPTFNHSLGAHKNHPPPDRIAIAGPAALFDSRGISQVALENVMGNGPSVNHHHATKTWRFEVSHPDYCPCSRKIPPGPFPRNR